MKRLAVTGFYTDSRGRVRPVVGRSTRRRVERRDVRVSGSIGDFDSVPAALGYTAFGSVRTGAPAKVLVYHGTSVEAKKRIFAEGFKTFSAPSHAVIDEFAREGRLLGRAVYFTPTPGSAKTYGAAIPVEVTVKNPYVVDRGSFDVFRKLDLDAIRGAGYDSVVVKSGKEGFLGRSFAQIALFDPTQAKPLPRVPRLFIRDRETGRVGEVVDIRKLTAEQQVGLGGVRAWLDVKFGDGERDMNYPDFRAEIVRGGSN